MEKINKNYWVWLLLISSIFVGQINRNGLNSFVSYLMVVMVVFCVVFITYKEVYLKNFKKINN